MKKNNLIRVMSLLVLGAFLMTFADSCKSGKGVHKKPIGKKAHGKMGGL